MSIIRSVALVVFLLGVAGTSSAPAADQPHKQARAQAAGKAAQSAVNASSSEKSAEQPAAAAAGAEPASKPAAGTPATGERRDDRDPLAANLIDDATLATSRGGSDSYLNQNNSTGTVQANVAENLTTGSNTISQSAFSNSSGIPIVIQNSGNNVLIQNSTILNLQLQK